MKRKRRKIKKIFLVFLMYFFIICVAFCILKFVKIENKEIPKITYPKIIATTKGESINLLEKVSVQNKDISEINIEVEGNYDFNKEGEYTLYYVVKDNLGNEIKEPFTLKVERTLEEDENHFTTSKGFKGEIIDGVTYIDGTLIVNKTYSLPSTFGNGLTEETKNAFAQLKVAALLEGLDIYIASGFRSYERQVTLYNNYVKRDGKEAADTYSARPGHSEHQSGLTFDVNEVSDRFHGTKEANWLSDNCYKFGFILRFPNGKSDETGFKYESWHFRYVGEDLAKKLYNNGNWITLEEYFGIPSVYEN